VTVLQPSRLAALCALILLGGCSWFGGSSESDTPPDPGSIPVEELYNRGVDAMVTQRYPLAVEQFDSIEQNYPYSSWAANAQLMAGYSQYLQQKYPDAIATLDSFIQLHPSHKDIAYAYYLRALSFYEQIEDIKREQRGTEEAMTALQEVITRFPDSAYARDAKLKIDLCRDHLAGKEVAIGLFYEKQHLYAAAVTRYQHVVDDYQTTNHAAEALERLVEVYLALGLPEQAVKTAAVLGYNYPGSEWYLDAYKQLANNDLIHLKPGDLPPVPRSGWFGGLFNWF
jgi:outer membrane protein assembly factor BamD